MKDILGRKLEPGQYIAYALLVGRSANLGVYKVKEVGDGWIRARKITESYADGDYEVDTPTGKHPRKFCQFVRDKNGQYHWEELSEDKKLIAINKMSKLSHLERALVLDNFSENFLR